MIIRLLVRGGFSRILSITKLVEHLFLMISLARIACVHMRDRRERNTNLLAPDE